ncbi:MAG TPA: rhodanese-like domain-containing protein, partial [Chthoniobacterales bacterium]|nr:rhodanese-like domain-containing protein [Chthoniobacterales bacterium]
ERIQMDYVRLIPLRPRGSNWRVGLLMTAAVVLVAGIGLAKSESFEWVVLKATLRTKFPNVRWISTEELAGRLADHSRQEPVLLDVRTEAEWNVSHLPRARRVDPGTSAKPALAGVAKDTPIVTYCAVGYRSGAMASTLRRAGYSDVRNLEGSIFQWANEHRPLVRDGEPVSQVHPFSALWGRLLASEVRAPLK